MSVATAALVGFVGRHSVIHLPERSSVQRVEHVAVVAPVVAKREKHHVTERPSCSCCGVAHFTVRAIERAELKEGAAPWLVFLCEKCGKRLLRKTAGAESY